MTESPPRRGIVTLLAAALALSMPLAAAQAQQPLAAADAQPTTESLLALACPQSHDRWSHLEAGRLVNQRLALAAAIRRAALLRDDRSASLRERMARPNYHPPANARQVAATLHRNYGANSLVGRGADALATIAIAAEDTTQLPLDGLNSITGTIFEAGSRALGIASSPRLELRSGITARQAGVTLSTDW